MGAKKKRFIIVGLQDTKSWGFNEATMPVLLRIVDSTAPTFRYFTHLGPVAYYLTSRQTLTVVEGLLVQAEALRQTDERFAAMGIGLAEGELIVDFDWLGRIRSLPLGLAAAAASRPGVSQEYQEKLRELKERLS